MKQNISIKLNVWIISAILLFTNLLTIGIWQPWSANPDNSRTIRITGSTTIEAEADQFTFNPYYQKEGADESIVNTELSQLATEITSNIKELGVDDSAIKVNVNSYDYGLYYTDKPETHNATLNVTVTVKDKEIAQKIQDYLVTTSPSGSIPPQAVFSTAKQQALESRAREEALADAKTKAEASAKQLNSSLGKVLSVTDGYGYSGGISQMPWRSNGEIAGDSLKDNSSFEIQPGLNEYNFSIEVVYQLK